MTDENIPMNTTTTPIRIVEMKLPLTWLLGSATAIIMAIASLVFQVSGATNGIADLKVAVQTIKDNQEKRDDRMNLMSGANIETRTQLNALQLELSRLSSEVNDLRRDYNRSGQPQQRYYSEPPKP